MDHIIYNPSSVCASYLCPELPVKSALALTLTGLNG